MRTRLSITSVVALLSAGPMMSFPVNEAKADVAVPSRRNVAEYNLTANVGLKGFDPVSYFAEGGGVPLMGDSKIRLDYEGVTYLFANENNLRTFEATPARYEPTYGGWCAYAMSFGSKVDIKPAFYSIHGNRIHFFVNRRAKQNFDADVKGHEDRADGFWNQISGEEPRR